MDSEVINEHSLVILTYISLTDEFLKVPNSLCRLLGYSEDELLSLKLDDFIFPRDYENYKDRCEKLLNGQLNSFDSECRCKTKSGETIWIHMNCSLVNDEMAKSICYAAYITDISRHKHEEAKLLEINKSLEKIISEQNA